jgi:plasmid stability protein
VASIIVRRLDRGVKARLRVRAAHHGRSMEEEAREILKEALANETKPANLAVSIRARFAPLGGVDIPALPREPIRKPPRFAR